MSELINNSTRRKELLKHMILQLHEGVAPEVVKNRLIELLQKIPYGEVVEVEQELIAEGLPEEEVIKLCDIHVMVLDGSIDHKGAEVAPPGHPVDTFINENKELLRIVEQLNQLYEKVERLTSTEEVSNYLAQLRVYFNQLMDVDKHYRRKENLLFPYLEKYGITGPPKVMWGKHDETRALLKSVLETLSTRDEIALDELRVLVQMVFRPASTSVAEMTMKEEEILLPMSMDTLNELEWYEIYQQTTEIGYCLFDPQVEWKPENIGAEQKIPMDDGYIRLPSGQFTAIELEAILNTLPIDITFVDKDDRVKYFSQGEHRIFDRSRSILNREVRLCHPPSSVHIVERILADLKSGKESRAPFWIELDGKFIHIEYFALRDKEGNYLGALEISQDLTNKRSLRGEQRLLSYAKDGENV